MASSIALKKVSDYIVEARILLQDRISPYRYDDASLVSALNLSLLEGRRLRADLYVYSLVNKDGSVQSFTDADSGQEVEIEQQFRQAFLNGMVGYALERDQEDIEDDRATMFIGLMRYMLTGTKPSAPRQSVAAVQGDS